VDGLRHLEWTTTYSTDNDDLVAAFYQPCLERSTAYWRAVGYFSSRVLALISPSIEQFYARNGRMRLIASPALSDNDRVTIQTAYRQRAAAEHLREDETVIACLRRYLDPARLESDEERLRLRLLAGMIRDGLLDIRIAVRSHRDGDMGLYHEKIGVFEDAAEDYVTFNGSPNESWNGWVHNVESFALHRSWGPEAEHARGERSLFLRTWEQQRPEVALFELNEAVLSTLFEHFPPLDPAEATQRGAASFRLPARQPPTVQPGLGLTYPDFIAEQGLREYQQTCIDNWFNADCRGTFALATGVGKTVIALAAARRFAEEHAQSGTSTLVLVIVPTQSLAAQWRRNARGFGFSATVCNSKALGWPRRLGIALSGLHGSTPNAQCVIVTADTMTRDKWESLAAGIESLSVSLFVVGDEMHSLGTRRRLARLPVRDDSGVGRMGLSATPRRHNDDQGTELLLDYFGEVLDPVIDIAEAIRLGALCPYTYNPIIARLNGNEQDRFDSLSKQIGKAWQTAAGDTDKFYLLAGRFLTQRVGLLSHAEDKTAKGLQSVRSCRGRSNQIVYTGEGVHPLTQVSQIDFLLGELRNDGIRANKFVYQTEADQRDMSLKMFQKGDLDVLVAMRCLDEGIDIPEARRGVILASTQNPRQFVQRRGRLLRNAPGKHDAELVDVLCLPSNQPDRASPAFAAERSLVAREMTRALELAEASSNGLLAPPEALTGVMAAYDLTELAADYGDEMSWIPGASR
jgi:superfamily II DNA or RNA helicase